MLARPALVTSSLLLLSALPGCGRGSSDPSGPGDASPSANVTQAPPSPPPPAPGPASSADAGARPPLQLLRFSFTSEVKGKEPVDRLERAEPGTRVWAHLAFRNRGTEPRPVHVVFRVNGEKRTTLDLKIEPSWSYRTYGFNTLKESDKGELTVTVTDDEGGTLVDEKLPIGKGKAKK